MAQTQKQTPRPPREFESYALQGTYSDTAVQVADTSQAMYRNAEIASANYDRILQQREREDAVNASASKATYQAAQSRAAAASRISDIVEKNKLQQLDSLSTTFSKLLTDVGQIKDQADFDAGLNLFRQSPPEQLLTEWRIKNNKLKEEEVNLNVVARELQQEGADPDTINAIKSLGGFRAKGYMQAYLKSYGSRYGAFLATTGKNISVPIEINGQIKQVTLESAQTFPEWAAINAEISQRFLQPLNGVALADINDNVLNQMNRLDAVRDQAFMSKQEKKSKQEDINFATTQVNSALHEAQSTGSAENFAKVYLERTRALGAIYGDNHAARVEVNKFIKEVALSGELSDQLWKDFLNQEVPGTGSTIGELYGTEFTMQNITTSQQTGYYQKINRERQQHEKQSQAAAIDIVNTFDAAPSPLTPQTLGRLISAAEQDGFVDIWKHLADTGFWSRFDGDEHYAQIYLDQLRSTQGGVTKEQLKRFHPEMQQVIKDNQLVIDLAHEQNDLFRGAAKSFATDFYKSHQHLNVGSSNFIYQQNIHRDLIKEYQEQKRSGAGTRQQWADKALQIVKAKHDAGKENPNENIYTVIPGNDLKRHREVSSVLIKRFNEGGTSIHEFQTELTPFVPEIKKYLESRGAGTAPGVLQALAYNQGLSTYEVALYQYAALLRKEGEGKDLAATKWNLVDMLPKLLKQEKELSAVTRTFLYKNSNNRTATQALIRNWFERPVRTVPTTKVEEAQIAEAEAAQAKTPVISPANQQKIDTLKDQLNKISWWDRYVAGEGSEIEEAIHKLQTGQDKDYGWNKKQVGVYVPPSAREGVTLDPKYTTKPEGDAESLRGTDFIREKVIEPFKADIAKADVAIEDFLRPTINDLTKAGEAIGLDVNNLKTLTKNFVESAPAVIQSLVEGIHNNTIPSGQANEVIQALSNEQVEPSVGVDPSDVSTESILEYLQNVSPEELTTFISSPELKEWLKSPQSQEDIQSVLNALVAPEKPIYNPGDSDIGRLLFNWPEIQESELYAINGGKLTAEQLSYAALVAGWDPEDIPTIVSICLSESGGNPNAVNDNSDTGDYSFGLCQINMIGSMTEERLKLFKHLGINSEEDLKDPVLNLQAARILKKTFGNSFNPWSDFKNKKYIDKFMTHAIKIQDALERISVEDPHNRFANVDPRVLNALPKGGK